jgi:hypothetical protein
MSKQSTKPSAQYSTFIRSILPTELSAEYASIDPTYNPTIKPAQYPAFLSTNKAAYFTTNNSANFSTFSSTFCTA